MRSKIILIIAIAALSATSCSKKEEEIDPLAEVFTINFAPALEHLGQQSRSSGYLDDNNDGYGGFAVGDVIGVFGYQSDKTTWDNSELPNLMHNITLTKQFFDDGSKNSDGTPKGVINYVYNPQRLWPELPNTARFFAYYPHNSSVAMGAITPSPATHSGYPFVEVVLGLSEKPIDFVTAQTDLMNKTTGTSGGGVTLTFAHRLSKLMFKVKASGLSVGLDPLETRKMYINQLRIKNVFNKAKYNFDDNLNANARGTWSDHALHGVDATSGATIATNSVMAEIGNDYQDLIDPHGAGSHLLMIPQAYDNVEFEVIYTIERLNANGGCEDRTVITKRFPASVNWKSGQAYTYYLEFGFSEVDESDIRLSLSVKPWGTGGYGIEMGK